MEYKHRLAEERFLRLNEMFSVVLVCGPRQAGKTTMLKHLAQGTNRTYVTLDDLDNRELAINDPKLFFQKFPTPILIDEIQFAPNLLSYIKLYADENGKPGEFWLTGSQSYKIMKNVSESLAGRIGIMHMYPMIHDEISGNLSKLPSAFDFDTLAKINRPVLDLRQTFDYIFKGGMPKALDYDDEMRKEYYASYISTFLLKDIMELGGITDTVRFNKFLCACASLNSNVVNFATLSSIADISQPTAKEWLQLLQGMGIVYLVEPYFNNTLKRLTKSPKLYFVDTGLCAYLAKIPSKEILLSSAFAGAYFENFVVNQFFVKCELSANHPNLYFYRDCDQNEVDILLESADGITPLEIKLSANPNKRDLTKFKVLDKLALPIKSGGIICLINSLYPADDNNSLIPVGLI